MILTAEETIELEGIRRTMRFLSASLIALSGERHLVNETAGYTNLNEILQCIYNGLPNILMTFESSFVLLTAYVEKASLGKDQELITKLKETLDLLKQSVDALKQGSIPNKQDHLIKDTDYSPNDWSKLCLPRPDFNQELEEEITPTISAGK
jgi:hypothetical protein